ncbi:MFS transporter [Rhodovarius lipocyclicus]|uniref:MFS transporter n=1 Tax=Rhodovarius lipocyclicus TaxID=268410 RepID=UPI001357693F|nr:MFS transporter [Rhodovarius lipocyclicus]
MILAPRIVAQGEDGIPTPQRYLAIATMAMAVFLSAVSASIINVALPVLGRELQTTPSEAIWVVSAFQVAMAACLLPFAALGEIYGYRRVYLTGLVAFTLASLGAAQAGSLASLTAWRVLQGLGSAGILGVNIAILRFVYPRRLLGQGVGINGFIASVSATVGPPLGSALLALGGWHWLFLVNVPIGLVALVLALLSIPETPRAHRKFDPAEAALSALTIGSFLSTANALAQGHPAWLVAAQAVLCLAAGTLLVLRETGRAAPMLPVDLFRIPLFRLSVLVSISSFTAQMLALVALPFFLERHAAGGAAMIGLLMAPWPAASMASAVAAGWLADRISTGLLGAIGLLLFAAGLAGLGLLPDQAAAWDVGWRMMLCGLGFGCFQSPNNRVLISTAPPGRSGAASGMLGTARMLGQSLGAALAALLLASLGDAGGMAALLGGATIALLAAAVSMLRVAVKSS